MKRGLCYPIVHENSPHFGNYLDLPRHRVITLSDDSIHFVVSRTSNLFFWDFCLTWVNNNDNVNFVYYSCRIRCGYFMFTFTYTHSPLAALAKYYTSQLAVLHSLVVRTRHIALVKTSPLVGDGVASLVSTPHRRSQDNSFLLADWRQKPLVFLRCITLNRSSSTPIIKYIR